MHPSLPGLLFWQAISASSAMEFSLYHLGMFEKKAVSIFYSKLQLNCQDLAMMSHSLFGQQEKETIMVLFL